MEKPIIEVKGIGKKYNINHGRGRYIALRDVLANITKHPFSFLKSKTKQVVGLEKKEEFWALKDISFTVDQGEVIGIIGPNGAGKSTLLKILSQITPPTTGEIILRGRVGSLLEVGTGFHPELTGRENVFLNGAILGMKRHEIARKFDEIVEFAGIEKFLDTPVKYYSSGMYVRLAFSVAAHMEPDILIVDEVLAVGDAEFQKKCLGKMEEVTKKQGRTILFVSHNMTAIKQLCKKTILLEKGEVRQIGKTNQVIDSYLGSARLGQKIITPNTQSDIFKIQKVEFKNDSNQPWFLHFKENLKIETIISSKREVENFKLGIGIDGIGGERICTTHSHSISLKKGDTVFDIDIKNALNPGMYSLSIGALNLFYSPEITMFEVGHSGKLEEYNQYNYGIINIDAIFKIVPDGKITL